MAGQNPQDGSELTMWTACIPQSHSLHLSVGENCVSSPVLRIHLWSRSQGWWARLWDSLHPPLSLPRVRPRSAACLPVLAMAHHPRAPLPAPQGLAAFLELWEVLCPVRLLQAQDSAACLDL